MTTIDNNGTIWAEVAGGITLDIGKARCCARDLYQCSTCGTRTNRNEDGCAWCLAQDREILNGDDTLGWVALIVRHSSGAVWCTECDGPFVSCGSIVHNPTHHTQAEARR